MLTNLRKILDFRMTIAEWIGTAVIVSVPYLLIGLIWTATHLTRFGNLHGFQLVVSLLASVASWPVLVIPIVCTP